MTTHTHSPYQDYFNRFDYGYYNHNYDDYHNISVNIENQTNPNINENLFEYEINFHNIAIRLNFDEVVDDDEDLSLTRLIPIESDRLRDIVANDDCCAFCLESYSFEDEGNICVSRCNHYFHTNCISNWLMTGHQTCPMCRTII